MRQGACGFTIIELTIVIVILGIMSASALTVFTGSTEYRLDATARKIASDLRYGQQLAMDNHGSYRISFDVASDEYVLYDRDSTSDPAKDPFTGTDFVVELNTEIFSGVTLAKVDFGGSAYVEFDKEGTPSAGGTIYIASGGLKKKIEVLSQTGLVRVSAVEKL